MAKKKLVSFRVDESVYLQLVEAAAQHEMRVGELAREIVQATLSTGILGAGVDIPAFLYKAL